MDGDGALVKQGNGTLALNHDNQHAGGTLVAVSNTQVTLPTNWMGGASVVAV
ncbi:autotransporter-associated beta strand repeat-containing protein, partial [Bordetella pertussis]|uniref:autotransporter-associated beta strand repeat-containing protein n=1 Tax=Bordetella pertussis TaxID=520 RepID=UPI0030C9C426